jgi:radical SAM superfamily enzyme YgiQ (UPF0313 family)
MTVAYDLVAISTLTARVLDAYAVADQLRAAGITVVIGGLHVSAMPQEAAAHADAIVSGEGEPVWADLLSDFERGQLARVYASRARRSPFHMRDARVPRYDLLDVSRYNRITLQTTRGCPLDCSFCGASRTISSYKRKSLDQVRRELEAILSIWPDAFIELADDNTFVDKRWSIELAALLGEYGVRWFTETDISVADDDRLLEGLAKSGCAQILIGLESSNADALRRVDRRSWKSTQAADHLTKVKRIQAHGIPVNGCFVFGLDDDDRGCFDRTREFVEESELCDVQITLLTPFPGTRLYSEMRRQGRLLESIFWPKCTLFDLTFRPACMPADELTEGFRALMSDLYDANAKLRRRARWRSCLQQRPRRLPSEDAHA